MMPLTILSTNAAHAALLRLVPLFEQDSGRRLSVSFSATRQIQERIMNGEAADVVIATQTGIEELTKRGKLAPATCTVLCAAGVGVGVRTGARTPDISTKEAFRRTLVEAKSIAYATHGVGGLLLTQIAERFGITEALQAKSRTIAGGLAGELVARGEAELCVQMESEILAVEGCVLVGPLPPGLQQTTAFAAALVCGTHLADVARAFISYLTSPAAKRELQVTGLNPL